MGSTEEISATKVRSAILEGKQEEAKRALDPRIAEVLTRPENVRTINQRASLIEEQNLKIDGVKELVSLEFQNLTRLATEKGLRAPSDKTHETTSWKSNSVGRSRNRSFNFKN